MRSLLLAMVLSVAGGGAGSVFGQRTLLISGDHLWRYAQPTFPVLDSVAWAAPGYDDSGWSLGRATLAWEPTPSTLAFLQGTAPTNTVLEPPEGRTDYFRAHFTWSGGTAEAVLVLSNAVDDGAVIYLNGVEQERLRLPDGAADVWGLFTTSTVAGGDVAAWEVLTLGGSNLVSGDNVLAVSVHQHSETSSDVVFGMMVWGIQPFAPVLIDPDEPSDANVGQGEASTLKVVADGYPAPEYQWFFRPEGEGAFGMVPGATGATHAIAAMSAADAGSYFCRLYNVWGITHSRTNTVGYVADVTPPLLVGAVRQPNITNIVVTFSEAMGVSALNLDRYAVCIDQEFSECLARRPTSPDGQEFRFVEGSGNTQVVMGTDWPEDLDQPYVLAVTDVSDNAGNPIPGVLFCNVAMPRIAVFRQGLDGYAGTADLHLRQDQPDTAFPTPTQVLVDSLNPVSHGLLRFDGLFGSQPGQIPFGALVNSATLSLRTLNATRTNEWIRFHRMLQPWTDALTWNAPWRGGLRADGAIAAAAADAQVNPATLNETVAVDVTASLQAWAGGHLNEGWFLTNTMTDGFQFASSEHPTEAFRPQLTVDCENGPPAPATLVAVPPTNVLVVPQGQPFRVAFGVGGTRLQFQWFKDGIALPAETNAALVRRAAAVEEGGAYVLHAENDLPSSTNSPVMVVQVLADTVPPVLTRAVATGSTNLTTLQLTFSEPLDPALAGQSAPYSLSPPTALAGATLLSPDTVRLSLNAPFGQRYTVTVASTVTDAHGNPIVAPGNRREVATSLALTRWEDVWHYCADGSDLMSSRYMAPEFDDASWPAGPGLLGTESAGGATLRTMLPATNFTSYYRRRVFWPYPASVLDAGVEFMARHVVDDGTVVWFNGVEVFRFKMPAGVVTHDTRADNSGAGDEAVLATNGVSAGMLLPGTNLLAADVHPVSATSSDNVFGLELLALLPPITPVSIDTLPPSLSLVVTQGQELEIAFGVSGYQPAFQWYKDGTPVPGATGPVYRVGRALAPDAGSYYLQVTNVHPSATNSPVVQLALVPDPVLPQLVSAVRQPELTNVVVSFSKTLFGDGLTTASNYVLSAPGDPEGRIAVLAAVPGPGNTGVVLQAEAQVLPGCTLTVLNVTDLAGNPLAPNACAVATPTGFVQGLNGYSGAVDTHVVRDRPDESTGTQTRVLVDGDNPVSHGLVRFDHLFGPGGVAPGALIHAALLRFHTANVGDKVTVHRLLIPWDESSTWNSLGGLGVVTDNRIASSTPDGTLSPDVLGQWVSVDVTSTVQLWATGALNRGWGLLNTGTDGFQCPSSESSRILLRPALIVEWSDTGACLPLSITAQPAASQTVVEGQPVHFELAVFGTGPCYQWLFNSQPIPGATNATFAIPAAVLTHAGTYRCIVTNACPSTVASLDALLGVTPDTIGPRLLAARARSPVATPTLLGVALAFDEPLAPNPAQAAGNYAVYASAGGSVPVAAAALPLPSTVELTLAAPLAFGTNYRVEVGAAITDTSAARNPILENRAPIVQQIVLLPYTEAWRYDETRTAADNYDTQVPAWHAAGFDASGWPAGAGILACETDPALTESFPAPVQTALGTTTETIYLRAGFVWPLGPLPSQAAFIVHHVIDDGLVCYLNGVDAFRHHMPEGPVLHATRATTGGEAVLASTNLSAASVLASNLVACSLHPVGPESTDAVFGLEIVAQHPAWPDARPELVLSRPADGITTLGWTPDAGTLQSAPSPQGPWSDIDGAPNPTVIPVSHSPRAFYRVRQ